jgi:oligoendopeptidase F
MEHVKIAPLEPFDWKSLEPFYQKLLEENLTAERVPEWLQAWSDLENIISEAWSVAHRAKNENTNDEAAEQSYLHLVENVDPHHQRTYQALTEKLLGVTNYVPLPEHQQILRCFQVEAKLFREANIPIQQEINKLTTQFDKLNGSLMAELDGRQITLAEAQGLLSEPDRTLRERAWRAITAAKNSIAEECDEIFLKLLKLRRQLAHNAGFADYRTYKWQEFKRFDYTPQDSLEFVASIEKEVTPLLNEIWEKRKQKLGVEPLRPWDLEVDPDSRPPLKAAKTTKELEDGLERIFTNLGPGLGQQFASMRNGWLELEPRPGKVSNIGYCGYFPLSKMPYIFYNLTGTHADVSVLLHEMGHAFHDFAMGASQPLVWNRYWTSSEFAEVASQAMELLTLPLLEKENGGFFSKEDAQRAREDQLLHVLMLFGVARGEAFQHWLYTEAPEDVTIEQINQKHTEIERRFRPFLAWQGLEKEWAKTWQYVHLFLTPFYMLDYAFAYLGAIQIWQNSLEDKNKALEQYRYALSLGSSRPLPELFEAAGAKFAFDRKTVRELVQFVKSQMLQ